MSIAESADDIVLDDQEAGPSPKDKVLSAPTPHSRNGASGNGSMSSTDDDSQHLPSFETHKQHSDSEGRSPKSAFKSMDLHEDSK